MNKLEDVRTKDNQCEKLELEIEMYHGNNIKIPIDFIKVVELYKIKLSDIKNDETEFSSNFITGMLEDEELEETIEKEFMCSLPFSLKFVSGVINIERQIRKPQNYEEEKKIVLNVSNGILGVEREQEFANTLVRKTLEAIKELEKEHRNDI